MRQTEVDSMHELAVTENLLQLALRHANGCRITDLYVVIGQLSSLIDDSVQFYWDIISEGTPAQYAKLHFRRVPAEMECVACEYRYPLRAEQMACPACGSVQVRLISGDEFYLDAIDVETQSEEQITT
jgi:hydrogenase nickel incorporation protein HypA/HybF